MTNLQLFAKCGLALLIVVSIAVLIERLTEARHVVVLWITDFEKNELEEVTKSTLSPIVEPDELVFSEKFSKCLLEHSKSHYYDIQSSATCIPHGECIYKFLLRLSNVLRNLDIKLMLLEPALLFCLLPSSRKYNLIIRGFNSNKEIKSRNAITFGITQSDAKILDRVSTRQKLISEKFKILRFETLNSEPFNRDESEMAAESSHYLILHYDMVMHLIVFQQKRTYLQSSRLNTSEITLNGLQYVNDRAFENFNTSLVHLDAAATAQIFLPLDTRCFLLDSLSSNFIKCNVSMHEAISNKHNSAMKALKELKRILASQMVTFWLWSKTLQGWYEKCDILQYSEELKFSVAAKSVSGFNFAALFSSSECQYINSSLTSNLNIQNIKLNCYGVPIDLIFMYEDNAMYWYEYTDEQNIYRLRFPKYTLCSTDVFGYKINVPCETSEIFEGEYGQFLKNTTLILDSENMKNVLPMGIR